MRPTHHNHGPCDHHDRSPAIIDIYHLHDGVIDVRGPDIIGPFYVAHDSPEYDDAIDRLLDHIDIGVLWSAIDRRTDPATNRGAHAAVSGVVDEQRDVPVHDCLERLRDWLECKSANGAGERVLTIHGLFEFIDGSLDGLSDGG